MLMYINQIWEGGEGSSERPRLQFALRQPWNSLALKHHNFLAKSLVDGVSKT